MTWVKVCGLTRHEDVTAAVDAGADALGFILAPASPRCVDAARAGVLLEGVPIETFLVTVDLAVAEALDALERSGATGIQPYGRHSAAVARAAITSERQVLRPAHAVDRAAVEDIPADETPLLDTPDRRLHGGTGRAFDWSAADWIDRDFVLAGGLGPDNVADAVARVAPWGVDASSRLEVAPGQKDPGKVLAYVEEAKRR